MGNRVVGNRVVRKQELIARLKNTRPQSLWAYLDWNNPESSNPGVLATEWVRYGPRDGRPGRFWIAATNLPNNPPNNLPNNQTFLNVPGWGESIDLSTRCPISQPPSDGIPLLYRSETGEPWERARQRGFGMGG